ncbi:TPA: hypothetical protein LU109_003601 [Enterobacter hormaechei subsp. xiangfangensis]|nr:hypothetical protein [Enterobacter hormaechei subsp. xiangfangensis]
MTVFEKGLNHSIKEKLEGIVKRKAEEIRDLIKRSSPEAQKEQMEQLSLEAFAELPPRYHLMKAILIFSRSVREMQKVANESHDQRFINMAMMEELSLEGLKKFLDATLPEDAPAKKTASPAEPIFDASNTSFMMPNMPIDAAPDVQERKCDCPRCRLERGLPPFPGLEDVENEEFTAGARIIQVDGDGAPISEGAMIQASTMQGLRCTGCNGIHPPEATACDCGAPDYKLVECVVVDIPREQMLEAEKEFRATKGEQTKKKPKVIH